MCFQLLLVMQDQQAIDQAVLDQEEFLDQINSQLLNNNNEDIDSFYGDDISYYQED